MYNDYTIEMLFDKLPNMVTVVKNEKSDSNDKYRVYDLLTKTSIKQTGASSVKDCLVKYFTIFDSQP